MVTKLIYQVLFIFLLTSCQDFNSNSFDETKFSPFTGHPALEVLRNRCISCHRGTHDWWSSLVNNSDWSNTIVDGNQYVIPGDFAGSYIIFRLKNFGSDMPDGGPALTEQELNLLRDWIENDVF